MSGTSNNNSKMETDTTSTTTILIGGEAITKEAQEKANAEIMAIYTNRDNSIKVSDSDEPIDKDIENLLAAAISMKDYLLVASLIPQLDYKKVRKECFTRFTIAQLSYLVQCGIWFGLDWQRKLEKQGKKNGDDWKRLTDLKVPVKNKAGDETVLTLPRIVLGMVDITLIVRASLTNCPTILSAERAEEYKEAGLPYFCMQIGIADGLPSYMTGIYTEWAQEVGYFLSKKKPTLRNYKQTAKVIKKSIGKLVNVHKAMFPKLAARFFGSIKGINNQLDYNTQPSTNHMYPGKRLMDRHIDTAWAKRKDIYETAISKGLTTVPEDTATA